MKHMSEQINIQILEASSQANLPVIIILIHQTLLHIMAAHIGDMVQHIRLLRAEAILTQIITIMRQDMTPIWDIITGDINSSF